jgi:integrase
MRDEWLLHCSAARREPITKTRASLLTEKALAKQLRERDGQLSDALLRIKHLTRQLEQALGRKVRTTPFPTLAKACADWKAKYQGRDVRHMKNVGWMIDRFVKDFGGDTVLDRLENREADLAAWLRSMKKPDGESLGAGVRHQYRRYVLKFLSDSGLNVDRKAIPAPKKHEIRRDRKRIEWLEKEQAEAVAAALPPYYADVWRVQVAIGLRPDELVTLKKSDLRGDMLTLSPLVVPELNVNLTLKTGSRTICVPAKTLAILRRRLKDCDIVFPYFVPYWPHIMEKKGREPWPNERRFEKFYRENLQAVKGMPFKLDCRTGRRTCGSILIRAGHSVEEVAALLGDRPETVREHYAAILPAEVRAVATAI